MRGECFLQFNIAERSNLVLYLKGCHFGLRCWMILIQQGCYYSSAFFLFVSTSYLYCLIALSLFLSSAAALSCFWIIHGVMQYPSSSFYWERLIQCPLDTVSSLIIILGNRKTIQLLDTRRLQNIRNNYMPIYE